jgi:hypothetical protein
MIPSAPKLQQRLTSGSQVIWLDDNTWRLEIPAGSKGRYRLAQLDDYTALPRHLFLRQPPLQMSLRARASGAHLPGTWGFGLWNDPFSFSLGLQGASRRLPSLPNTAWFFFASPPNSLSFCDDLPSQGFLAATFRSPAVSGLFLGISSPLAVFALFPPLVRLARRIARRFIVQDTALLSIDPTEWHAYTLEWSASQVQFQVDQLVVLETTISPAGPLGLVLWIDNQYAALTPGGKIGLGTLSNPEPAWIEIANLQVFNS